MAAQDDKTAIRVPTRKAHSVLVTGATGFLGRHVLQAIRAQEPDTHICALVRNPAEWHAMAWTAALGPVDLIQGGVTGDDAWLRDPRLNGLGGILHLAAVVRHSRRNPQDIYETNIQGLLRMVRLASKHTCRIVFASTSGTVACFNRPDKFALEDAPYVDQTVRNWPYYDSKIQAEKQARMLAAELGVTLTVVRPPVLLGPGDHKFRSTGHVIKHLRRQFPFLIHGGMHFVDVRDASSALLRALRHPAARPVYHLGGTSTSIEEFFRMVQDVSGVPAPTRVVPQSVAWALAAAAEEACAHLPTQPKSPFPDPVVIEMAGHWWNIRSRYAEAELGYLSRPPYQTLADTVTWLRENHPALQP